ncbi:MAG: YbhB/YbcL family Raf kinase inhibitor-like protein, partial [Pseudomonadota bacterium]|nr:YbhB/YbcL family Raf kinase inhibitor-like protein [Pseudomonadota bacterium]
DTKSITIIVDDPDAIKPAGKVWVHWNVFNIPVTTSDFSLDVGTKPAGTIGKGHGGSGYKGMCPPDGEHTYRIAIYAQKEDVKAKATGFSAVKYKLERFEKDFGSSIIEKSLIEGTFK